MPPRTATDVPPRKRSAIIAVWDFCRAVDDAVDEAPEGANAAERLSLWRDELDQSGRDYLDGFFDARRLAQWSLLTRAAA